MTKIWIDSDLLDNQSGIGRDSKLMVEWLSANFECQVADWPRSLDRKSSYRRKMLLALRLVFGDRVHLPNAFQGALYQSQLGPLIPGKEIRVWISPNKSGMVSLVVNKNFQEVFVLGSQSKCRFPV